MGIQGLLQALKPFAEPVEIKKYTGKRVGIDAYSWLHKGAYACSMELCEQKTSTGPDGTLPLYVQYCMHRINMLRHYKVVPVVVFDGGYLPQKAATESHRARKRKSNLEQARLRLSAGDYGGAIELYQRAVEITPVMAYELIKVLKRESVEFIVAPYEADPQLAFLANRSPEDGGIAAVISEDSDLLAYGCNVVIYKMDRFGNGDEIELQKVLHSEKLSNDCLSFRRFTKYLFTGMCVLAGCDFLPSIPGIGVKRAHALVSKYSKLDRVLSKLRCDIKFKLPEDYTSEFKKAMALFFHARVYDPTERKLSYLSPLPEALANELRPEIDFLGPDLPLTRVVAIAEGRLDPTTMRAFDEEYSNSRHIPVAIPSVQANVWWGNEVESLEFVAPSSTSTSEDVSVEFVESNQPDLDVQGVCGSYMKKADTGFIAQIDLLRTNTMAKSRREGARGQPCDMNQDITAHKTIETRLSKRVRPPLPDNNPFKIRKHDKSAKGNLSLNTLRSEPEASIEVIDVDLYEGSASEVDEDSKALLSTRRSSDLDLCEGVSSEHALTDPLASLQQLYHRPSIGGVTKKTTVNKIKTAGVSRSTGIMRFLKKMQQK